MTALSALGSCYSRADGAIRALGVFALHEHVTTGAITRTAAFQAGVDKLIVSRPQARGMS